MNDHTRIYREKDKPTVAYLLLCKDSVRFEGTEALGDVLYFLFSPADAAKHYSEQFMSKQAQLVQPKDYAEASQTVTELIWKWRKERDVMNGGNDYGRYR